MIARVLRPAKLASSATRTRAHAHPVVSPGWWLNPVGILLGFLLPVLCFVAYVGELRPEGLTVRGLRFLDVGYLSLAGGMLFLMAVSSYVGSRIRPSGPDTDTDERIHAAAKVLGWITLVAYIFWLRTILLNPSQLYDLVTGQWRPSRQELGAVSGVSSLVNIAPAFASLVVYLVFVRRVALDRQLRWLFYAAAIVTPIRVYLWAERLALIEFVLPLALCWFSTRGGKLNAVKRFVKYGGPYLALPLLVVYFGVSEYFRSWQSETYQGKLAFWDFASGRLASYYYTALNNGAGLMATSEGPDYRFVYSLGWLYKLPLGLGRVLTIVTDSYRGGSSVDFLESYADPEFTNPSGVFAIVVDMGLPLALAYFCIIAFLAGIFYRRMAEGRLSGMLLYPLFFMSFIEVLRLPYFGSPRAFTWFLGVLIVMFIVKRPHPVRYRLRRAA